VLVFGIDPGIANTGYALVEKDKHDSFKVLETNNFVTKKIQTEKRLNQIFEFLKEKANSYSPDCFAIEKLYFNKNTKTALTIEEVRGIILLLAAQLNIQIFQYTPLEVKKNTHYVRKSIKVRNQDNFRKYFKN